MDIHTKALCRKPLDERRAIADKLAEDGAYEVLTEEECLYLAGMIGSAIIYQAEHIGRAMGLMRGCQVEIEQTVRHAINIGEIYSR